MLIAQILNQKGSAIHVARASATLAEAARDLDALLANDGSAPEEEQRTAARAPADKSAPDSLDMT